MSKAFLKHEFRTLLLNPATPVFLSFAWAAAALMAFYWGGFFVGNESSGITLFGYLPWVFALMLPALTMGLWAEDWRKGMAERLFTLPISPLHLSITRFLALWLVVGLFLLGTWPFVATLLWLGSPAPGPLFTGYLGAWLIGGTMLSASLLVSAASRSFVTAFVAGLVICLGLLFSGWASGLAWLSGYAPGWLVNALREASLMEHYRTFILGQINLRSVIYLLALTAAFQTATYLVLARRLELTRNAVTQTATVVALGSALVLAAVAMFIPGRLDLTPDRLYTLAPQTIALLKQLPSNAELLVYSSESNSEVPAATRRLARNLSDILRDFKTAAPNFNYRLINTDTGIAQELAAVEDGITEQKLQADGGYYFGVTINNGGRKVSIRTLTPEREPYMEFDLASLIASSLKTKNKVLGVILVPELANDVNRPQVIKELEQFYQVRLLRPGAPDFPEDIDALLVLPAPYYPQETLYGIGKYLMQGGRVMAFMDPFYRTHPADFPNIPDRNADPFADDHIADLLRKYGLEYPGQQIVADTYLAAPIAEESIGQTGYPLFIIFGRDNINQKLPFASFVNRVMVGEAGQLIPSGTVPSLTFEPILTTSPEGQIIGRNIMERQELQSIGSSLKSERQSRIVAALLTGKFPNAYPQQPQAVSQFYQDFAAEAEGNAKFIPPHDAAAVGSKPGALIAIADMDFLAPDFTFREIPSPDGEQQITTANDNLVLFFNMLQWLTDEGELLGLRGKGNTPRTFTRVEKMLVARALQAQKAEAKLASELYDVTNRLAQLRARNADGEQTELNQVAIQELATYANREFALKANLRQIRRDLRNEVARLGNLLALANATLMPVLVLCAYAVFRKRRRKISKSE